MATLGEGLRSPRRKWAIFLTPDELPVTFYPIQERPLCTTIPNLRRPAPECRSVLQTAKRGAPSGPWRGRADRAPGQEAPRGGSATGWPRESFFRARRSPLDPSRLRPRALMAGAQSPCCAAAERPNRRVFGICLHTVGFLSIAASFVARPFLSVSLAQDAQE